MAVYVPQAQRRRRVLIVAVAALVAGLALGVLVGRLTAPTPADRVAEVQGQARQISAQLRVLSLHVQGGAASLAGGGDAGASLALHRADDDLGRALEQAPWVPAARGADLRARMQQLERAAAGAASAAFAADVDRLAADIDATFAVA